MQNITRIPAIKLDIQNNKYYNEIKYLGIIIAKNFNVHSAHELFKNKLYKMNYKINNIMRLGVSYERF